MRSLTHFFHPPFSSDHPIAYCDSGPKTHSEFSADVAALAQFYSNTQGQKAALFCKGTYAFAVAFFGLLHAGKFLIMPPNLQTGTREHLPFDFLVTDTQVGAAIGQGSAASGILNPLPLAPAALCLLTSGSSGERKFVEKSLAQLEAEISVLEKTFGATMQHTTLVATVSHQHIYGLLFRCLWPLMAGRPFEDITHALPDSLHAATLRFGRIALVSSPALLRRLPDWGGLQTLAPHLATVFSSGGPLPLSTAEHFKKTIGFFPTEVFGSTETGGIAHRHQTHAESPWQPFPEVSVKVSQDTLCVHSPWVSPANHWFETGDGAAMIGATTFKLLGRKDRIVKIEEKRISLTEMEHHCLNVPGIKDVAIVALERAKGRQVLGCVFVAPPDDTTATIAKLKSHLSQFFEDAFIPKHFRRVDALTEDSQGKRSTQTLAALFEKESSSPKTLPHLVEKNVTAQAVRLAFNIPEDLTYFDGHFPRHPIVPGFVQIDWVMHFARQFFPIHTALKKMESVKFLEVIQPNERIDLTLEFKPERHEIIYTFTNPNKTTGSGRLYFQ